MRSRTALWFAAFLAAGLGLAAQAMMKLQPGAAGGVQAMTAPAQSPAGANGAGGDPRSPRIPFTSLEAATALAARGPAILFFSAGWCPTCRAALKEIDARAGELAGISIVVADYDSTAALKKRYGVTSQHTFVLIDGAGAARAAWNGGGVDEILARAARAPAARPVGGNGG